MPRSTAAVQPMTIVQTRTFFAGLAAACDDDVAQVELALSTLAGMDLDEQTLSNFQTVQDDAARAAARCRSTIAVLDDRHRQLEEAVNATPDAARTDFYRDGTPAGAGTTPPGKDPSMTSSTAAAEPPTEPPAAAPAEAAAEEEPSYRRCDGCGYVLGPRFQGAVRCPSCMSGTAFTPTTVTFPDRPSDEAINADTRDVEAQIRATYAQIADRPGALVPLTELRAALPPELDRETVDAALSKLGWHDDVSLSPRRDHHQTNAETQAAALRSGGGYEHQISIADQRSLSGVLQRVESTDPVHAASMLAPLDQQDVVYVAERMGVDPTGPVETVRQRIIDKSAANRDAWMADARQGEQDGTLLYRADNDPEWVADWTDEDRRRAEEAAARLQHRAATEPSWAYVRERADRWAAPATAPASTTT